jgi:hypothetical protein
MIEGARRRFGREIPVERHGCGLDRLRQQTCAQAGGHGAEHDDPE